MSEEFLPLYTDHEHDFFEDVNDCICISASCRKPRREIDELGDSLGASTIHLKDYKGRPVTRRAIPQYREHELFPSRYVTIYTTSYREN